jgi:dUTP pyrophosphatase
MALYARKLVPEALLPSRATEGAAGYDIYAADNYIIPPGHREVVGTGITVQLPPGTYGRIAARTGLAVKHGLDVLGGVVDPDYKDELKVVLINTDLRFPFRIKPGYRIAQLILENYTVAQVEELAPDSTPIIE